jgi:pyrrolidone-carboxylate peptidase
VLEVSYAAVDEFLESVGPFDAWLALGLANKSKTMLYETVGRNYVGGVADVRGVVAGPGVIDPIGPPAIAASLWHGSRLEFEGVEPSVNAGDYLCNYLLYRALRRFPEWRIGFLHLPPFSIEPHERQASLLQSVFDAV